MVSGGCPLGAGADRAEAGALVKGWRVGVHGDRV